MLIVSVLAVTALVNWADKTEPVWVARTSLSEGTILTKKHVKKESGRIREAGSQYLGTNESPLGKKLTQDVANGALVPKAAIASGECGNEINIPVQAQHLPPSLKPGNRVNLIASGDKTTASVVLYGAVVQEMVEDGGTTTGKWSLTVRVHPNREPAVIDAIRGGNIDITKAANPGPDTNPCKTPPSNVDEKADSHVEAAQ